MRATVSASLAQKLYAEQQAAEGSSAEAGGDGAESGEDVVDAEFEEVDNDEESKSD